jgi:predicted nucleotidyltransferase
MPLDERLLIKRDEILRIAHLHGADRVRIFGSFALGEARPDSDVDLLVAMAPGSSLLDEVALWQDLQELLGCKVDLVTDGGLSPYLREQIMVEAIAL